MAINASAFMYEHVNGARRPVAPPTVFVEEGGHEPFVMVFAAGSLTLFFIDANHVREFCGSILEQADRLAPEIQPVSENVQGLTVESA